MRTRIIFVGLSERPRGALSPGRPPRRSTSRTYIAIQEQYLKLPSGPGLQRPGPAAFFPSFPQATIEGRHVPRGAVIRVMSRDIGTDRTGGSGEAPSQDFFQTEPDAKQLAQEYHLNPASTPPIASPLIGSKSQPPSDELPAYGAGWFTSFDRRPPYTAPAAGGEAGHGLNSRARSLVPRSSSTNYGDSVRTADRRSSCILTRSGPESSATTATASASTKTRDAHQNLIMNPGTRVHRRPAQAPLNRTACAAMAARGEGGAGPAAEQPGPPWVLQNGSPRLPLTSNTGSPISSTTAASCRTGARIANDYNDDGRTRQGPGAVINDPSRC